jgi:hypothetical protein
MKGVRYRNDFHYGHTDKFKERNKTGRMMILKWAELHVKSSARSHREEVQLAVSMQAHWGT